MHTLRFKIPFFVLIALTLLLSAASSPNPQARWVIETVDAPRLFENLTPGMLKVIDGISYMAFGGDHMYYATGEYDTHDWSFTTVDNSSGVGSYASLAQDVNGNTFISYYDSINTSLKFATPGTLGIGWQVETVDATPGSGKGSAISALTDGQPHISYLNGSTLKYTQRICSGLPVVCVWSTPEAVDVGVNPSGTTIAIANDGTPHIAYLDNSGRLKHATKTTGSGSGCAVVTSWSCEILSNIGVTGTPSIAVWNTYPRIAYTDPTLGIVFTAFNGSSWLGTFPHDGDVNYGMNPSLSLDSSGIPHISYRGNSAEANVVAAYAKGGSVMGNPWTHEVIPGTLQVGQTAIAFNQATSGYPCILYSVAYYERAYLSYTCKTSSWVWPRSVVSSAKVGLHTSLALNANGVPYIAYQERLDQVGVTKSASWSTTPGNCWGSDGTGPWKCGNVNDLDINFGNGYMNSIAINPLSGLPSISYLDKTGVDALGYAWYVGSGGNCTDSGAWNCTIVYRDVDELPGYESSLAFSSDGIPAIAFSTGSTTPYLGLARYVGSHAGNCTNDDWQCGIIDHPLGTYGGQASLALTSTGKAVISYNDSNLHRLRLAMEGIPAGTGCNATSYPGTWKCMTLDPNLVAGFTNNSLALLSDTEAGISYSTNSLGVLQFVSVVMPDVVNEIRYVDANHAGYYNSMALYQGGPWIAYSDGDAVGHNTLRLAHWVGVSLGNCGSYDDWQCEVLDDDGSVGQYPSIKISDYGTAYISYYDDANGDLKIAYTRLFNFMPLLIKP
jgi:hypothetical protein